MSRRLRSSLPMIGAILKHNFLKGTKAKFNLSSISTTEENI